MKVLLLFAAHRSGGPAICWKLHRARPSVLQLGEALEMKTYGLVVQYFWQGEKSYQLQIPHKSARFRTRVAVMTIQTSLIVTGDVPTW
jgi:hypothetical protein